MASVAAFLLDAARSELSANTVLQVLQHWVDEGLSGEQLRHSLAVADESCPLRHRPVLNGLRQAVAAHFSLPEES